MPNNVKTQKNKFMFSERIKELCIQNQMPQRQLAAALDIDTATYCKIEKGEFAMLVKVLGKKNVDFNSVDGRRICGTQIFVAYRDPSPNSEVEGELVDKVFIPTGADVRIPEFRYGETYDFVYETVGIGVKAKSELREIVPAK